MLFANNETVKLFFDDAGKITDNETKNWIEVLKELPFSLHKKLTEKMSVKMQPDGTIETNLGNLKLDEDFLKTVIVSWSEPVEVTVDNITKMKASVVEELEAKLMELYGLKK